MSSFLKKSQMIPIIPINLNTDIQTKIVGDFVNSMRTVHNKTEAH